MEEGLPAPELQHEILGPGGRVLARVDFCWEGKRTIGEYDGKIKYGRLLRPGQRIEDVIFDEKVREDALRDLGWQIVRWLWRDLYRSGASCESACSGHLPAWHESIQFLVTPLRLSYLD
jgi:hypothetical protein